MKIPHWKMLWRMVRYLIVAGVLALMGWTFYQYRADIAKSLATANWGWLSVALALNLFGSLVYLMVWQRCVRQLGGEGGLKGALIALSVAGAARYVPGAIWPVAGLVYFAPQVGLPRRMMPVLAVWTQLLHLLAAGLVGIVSFGLVLAGLGQPLSWTVFGGLGLALLLGLGAAALLPRYLAALLLRLGKASARPEQLRPWYPLAISALFWLINGLRLWCLQLTFGPFSPRLILYLICAGAATTVLSGLFFFVPLGLGVIELSLAGWLGAVLPWPVALGAVTLNRVLRTLNDFFFLALAGWLWRNQSTRPVPEPPPPDERLLSQVAAGHQPPEQPPGS